MFSRSLLSASLFCVACESNAVVVDAGRDARTASDAQMTDAALILDAGADAGATPDAPPGCVGLLCDDFEGGALDASLWGIVRYDTSALLEVQSGSVAHGMGALHARLPESGNVPAYAETTGVFPALAGGLWGRASFRMNVEMMAGHTHFIEALSGDSHNTLEIGYYQGAWQMTFYDVSGESPSAMGSVPRDRWACLEWHFQPSAPQIEIYVDGTLAASFSRADITVPAFNALRMGIQNHSPQAPASEAFYDDVVVGAARVGCP